MCVAIDLGAGAADPSLAVLENLPSGATRGSDCLAEAGRVTDRRTGKPAFLLTAVAVQWVSKNEGHVDVTQASTPERSARRTYRVAREAGTWTALGPVMKDGPL